MAAGGSSSVDQPPRLLVAAAALVVYHIAPRRTGARHPVVSLFPTHASAAHGDATARTAWPLAPRRHTGDGTARPLDRRSNSAHETGKACARTSPGHACQATPIPCLVQMKNLGMHQESTRLSDALMIDDAACMIDL